MRWIVTAIAAAAAFLFLTQHISNQVEAQNGKSLPQHASDASDVGRPGGVLASVLASMSDAHKSRHVFRHPYETLKFFEIEPGMRVADAYPSEWYGAVFTNYLGEKGHYIGAFFPKKIYEYAYGDEFEKYWAETTEKMRNFPAEMAKLADNPPHISAFRMFDAGEDMSGTIDVYFFARSLHHANRYGGPAVLNEVAVEAFRLLKAGGIAGVVQHEAPSGNSDVWADGRNGYLKRSRVIEAFTKAGFVLEAQSDINANPKDVPGEREFVWRLPPTNNHKKADAAKYKAIGESNRMTLKFRKPE